mmetsp:Transcript_34594/g.51640  ORF Transcript_34594/g.51640 Transcript_34594/m.51640 type:complete len:81 (+) Transcript_34594:158-400(+)
MIQMPLDSIISHNVLPVKKYMAKLRRRNNTFVTTPSVMISQPKAPDPRLISSRFPLSMKLMNANSKLKNLLHTNGLNTMR